MKNRRVLLLSICFYLQFYSVSLFAQEYSREISCEDEEIYLDSLRKANNRRYDSLYIQSNEHIVGLPFKILHAEPLYIDLIRDLGARKGEAEWNIGLGMTDLTSFTRYDALIEYEFAPINRLGVEIELPVSFHQNNPTNNSYPIPSDRINGLKLATQYTFLVNEKYKTSMAIGYIHEFAMQDFYQNINGKFYNGNIYNPFFVAAKRIYNNYHFLLYTGPKFIREMEHTHHSFEYAINFNFHYMISGTRNFIGVEWNTLLSEGVYYVVARPQMRLELNKQFMVGVVSSMPLNYGVERFGTFLRLIYEPKHVH